MVVKRIKYYTKIALEIIIPIIFILIFFLCLFLRTFDIKIKVCPDQILMTFLWNWQ